VFAVQLAEGPWQKVGVEQVPLLQTPEQQTPPVVVLQLVPSVRQVLPGPPSLFTPPSSGPPSFVFTGWELPQLHPAKVYPTVKAAIKTRVGLFILGVAGALGDSAVPSESMRARQPYCTKRAVDTKHLISDRRRSPATLNSQRALGHPRAHLRL